MSNKRVNEAHVTNKWTYPLKTMLFSSISVHMHLLYLETARADVTAGDRVGVGGAGGAEGEGGLSCERA